LLKVAIAMFRDLWAHRTSASDRRSAELKAHASKLEAEIKK
jgi:hypothetical protein